MREDAAAEAQAIESPTRTLDRDHGWIRGFSMAQHGIYSFMCKKTELRYMITTAAASPSIAADSYSHSRRLLYQVLRSMGHQA